MLRVVVTCMLYIDLVAELSSLQCFSCLVWHSAVRTKAEKNHYGRHSHGFATNFYYHLAFFPRTQKTMAKLNCFTSICRAPFTVFFLFSVRLCSSHQTRNTWLCNQFQSPSSIEFLKTNVIANCFTIDLVAVLGSLQCFSSLVWDSAIHTKPEIIPHGGHLAMQPTSITIYSNLSTLD